MYTRFKYIGFMIVTFGFYYALAVAYNKHAKINFFDKNYFSRAEAFTSRKRRGEPYLTNITYTSLRPLGDDVTMRVEVDIKTVGTIHIFEKKFCELTQMPWFNLLKEKQSNFTICPVPPDTYILYNLEIPPKNFPTKLYGFVGKWEGVMIWYFLKTQNKKPLLHGQIYVIAT